MCDLLNGLRDISVAFNKATLLQYHSRGCEYIFSNHFCLIKVSQSTVSDPSIHHKIIRTSEIEDNFNYTVTSLAVWCLKNGDIALHIFL